jgi:hypothetical protein
MRRLALSTLIVFSTALQAQPAPEAPPMLEAAALLPAQTLKGEHYTVSRDVTGDGFLLDYVLLSDFGPFRARGPGVLSQRIHEIDALAALKTMEDSEAFRKGFADASKDTARDFRAIATSPVDTLTGIPSGVGRFFERTTLAASTGIRQLGHLQAAHEGKTAPEGPGAKLPGKDGPEPAVLPSVGGETARLTGRVAADTFGYDRVRRMIAREVQVDPYTTNPALKERLDELARTAFAGNLGIAVIKAALPATLAVDTAGTLSTFVWDTLPGDLRVDNKKRLLALGASEDAVNTLLAKHWFTMSAQTRFAHALSRVKGVPGATEALAFADSVVSEEQALFVVNTVEMLAHYHEHQAPLTAILARGTLMGRTGTGETVVVAPVDYLTWSGQLERFLDHDDVRSGKRSAWLSGRASPVARKALEEAGWGLHEGLDWAPVSLQALTAVKS